MSFFGSKKSSKNDTTKMKTLKVEFSAPKAAAPTPKGRGKKHGKPMNFSEWVDSYVAQSKGNPV